MRECSGVASSALTRLAKEVEVSLGEYVYGASPVPGIFLGTSNSGDRGRIR